RVDRAGDGCRRGDDLVGTRTEQPRTGVPHWAHRLLVTGFELAPRQVPGDLRFRPVKRICQWPADRQQLARRIYATGALLGNSLSNDAAIPARELLLPAAWNQAGSRPLPYVIRYSRLRHGGRLYRCDDLLARTDRGRVVAGPFRRGKETGMRVISG